MKESYYILVSFIFALSLISCGDKNEENNNGGNKPNPPTETEPVINTQVLKTGIVHQKGTELKTFLVSDGDNIAYNLWSQQEYFGNPLRGTILVGYTITPSLYDFAPAALRWCFEKSTPKDYFVCGPSGSSYILPSKMASDKLDAYVSKLNDFTGTTGLTICNIVDNGAINRMDIWNKYLAQPNIDALIYTGYGETPRGSKKS